MTDVFAIGSCRLIAPLHRLAREGSIGFSNESQSWYGHSAAEMLQRLDHMQGRRVLSDDQLEYVLDIESCSTAASECSTHITLPPVGLFEISTRNSYWRDGHILHSTLVSKRDVKDAEGKVATFDAVETQLMDLAAQFRHLVLVCNIAYKADLKATDQNRLQLNYFLKNLGHAHANITVVDPNEMIDAVQPQKDLPDNNHFYPAFEGRMERHYKALLAGLS
jgi:hypothetical protein